MFGAPSAIGQVRVLSGALQRRMRASSSASSTQKQESDSGLATCCPIVPRVPAYCIRAWVSSGVPALRYVCFSPPVLQAESWRAGKEKTAAAYNVQ